MVDVIQMYLDGLIQYLTTVTQTNIDNFCIYVHSNVYAFLFVMGRIDLNSSWAYVQSFLHCTNREFLVGGACEIEQTVCRIVSYGCHVTEYIVVFFG